MSTTSGGPVEWRHSTEADLPNLALWNHQLIRDEGHRNQMSVDELEERMRDWLQSDYKAVVFSAGGEAIGYALFRNLPDYTYLRQFFMRTDCRRKGFGRECIRILREDVWPMNVRLTVDVLCGNARAVAFWRAVGFSDYSMTLEIMPGGQNV